MERCTLKAADMTFELQCKIPANHPSLPGHFPGAPIVPGVVILDEVAEALAQWRNDTQLVTIRTVKFLAPLKPEQPFLIRLSAPEQEEDQVDFCCQTADRVIVQGRLLVRRRPS